MDILIVSVSPRGYGIAGTPEGGVKLGVADATVDQLHHFKTSTTKSLHAWPYRKQVLTAATRLFGRSFFSWVATQYRNPYLYGRNFEFLEDTLRFIVTGRRRMGVRSWAALMEEDPDKHPRIGNRQPGAGLIPTYPTGTTTANVLAEWCSHPGGFEDLMETLAVMYGKGFLKNQKV